MNPVVQRRLDTVGTRAGVPFAVTLPQRSRHDCGGPQPAFTLHLRTEHAAVALATRGHIGLREARAISAASPSRAPQPLAVRWARGPGRLGPQPAGARRTRAPAAAAHRYSRGLTLPARRGGAPHHPEPSMIEGSCHCGAARWRLTEMPESATACNCTACRRYGVLWAYGFEGENITVSGPTTAYVRSGPLGGHLSFNFCPQCGGVTHWRGLKTDDDGRRRIAVNLRMTEPGPIAHLPVDHFDGLQAWEDLPRDGRCIRDLWF